MNSVSSTEADLLRFGYDTGHITKAQIIAWADQQIERSDKPSNVLIDLSLCRDNAANVVLSNLRAIGGNDAAISVKIQIAFLGLSFDRERISLEQAVRSLYHIGHDLEYENGVDDEQRNMIYHLDDGYSLAFSQTYGTIGEIEQTFREFVQPYINWLNGQFGQILKHVT